MSVTQYEIPCAYDLLKLKDTVFFLSKNSLKTITIDNGEAYATFVNQSPQPPSPNRLKGFNVKLTETESLDERYKFTKQLTMSITGHLTDSRFLMDDDYYIVVQTEDGTYYLVNVDFPSKMTYTYNLSNGQNQTDFTFTSNSNHPTLKLNWNPVTWNTCQTYQVFGIDGLKLLEKDYTTIDAEQGVINLFDGHEFKDVDFLKNTISLQEAYDGELTTTTISFEIPFNNYKPSWQYNLLEFDQNLYAAHITPKSSDSGIFAGYEHGLQPSYEINGNTSIGESTTIKITLVEASNWGIFEFDTWSYYRDSTKTWVGIDSEVKCIGLGVGINALMEEVDGNGTPTGRYKCLEGYQNYYTNYNIVGTYTEDEVESFRTSVCTRFRTSSGAPTGYYTCINGDKYELIGDQTTYDGKHWIVDSYEIGQMVESGSSWCEIEPQYKWEISDEWECIDQFVRWIPSGTTCILGDKYQNNYKQVSDDNVHWRDSDPLEWSASTVVEYDSEDCRIYRWSPTDDTICVEESPTTREISGTPYCDGVSEYVDVYFQISYDSGTSWITSAITTTLVERCSETCGCTGDTYLYQYLTFVPDGSAKFTWSGSTATNKLSYSLDSGATWSTPSASFSVTTSTPIMWKGNLTSSFLYGVGKFSANHRFSVEGNIMSLLHGDGIYQGENSLDGYNNAFYNLFESGNTMTSAEHLILPSMTLTSRCYSRMFAGCTSLTTAPTLSATTLVNDCYNNMFNKCTSLNSITCLATDISASNCTFNWVVGVPSSNGTFTKAASMNDWTTGNNGIPSNWTIVNN